MLEDGIALLGAGRIVSAVGAFYRAHRETPHSAAALHRLGNALLAIGRADEAFECAYEAHLRRPDSALLQSNLLQTSLYAPAQTPETVADLHRQWGKRHDQPREPRRRISRERLHIGYVSMNFCVSPDAFFLEPVIRHHDREHFDIYCYSNSAREDWRSNQFRRYASDWRSITNCTDAQFIDQVDSDDIDVLVECSGHFADSSIRVFCSGAAPLQVGFPIYPATTGLSTIQYRVADEVVDPPGSADYLYAESLVRLPEVFTCYAPYPDAPGVEDGPAARSGHITFGCFNRLHKVNSGVVDAFAAILSAVPGSRLLLHHVYGGLQEVPEELTNHVRTGFDSRGVDGARIRFVGALPPKEHLAAYGEVDMSLDSFPYAGMTTTCDSLWMGVPVVTLAGSAHVSRTGASRLASLGLHDWIAPDVESYIRIAVERARDVEALRLLRHELRNRMRESAILDGERYTRHLEAAYREMARIA